MKRSLAWHREGIENFEASIARERQALRREFACLAAHERRVDRMARQCAQMRRQLAAAEEAGREDYDAGKYRGGRDAVEGPVTGLGLAFESSGNDSAPALLRVVSAEGVPEGVVAFVGPVLPDFELVLEQEPIPGGVLVRVRAVPPKARP